MVDQATFQGNWNQVRGKLKEKWGQLTDDDLQSFNGNMEQLIGRIQQRTGEGRAKVEEFLGGLSGDASGMLEQGKTMAQDAMHRGQEAVNQTMERGREAWDKTSGQVSERFNQGYEQAEKSIQEHPAQAISIAFAAGLVTGLGICMLLSRRETTYEQTSRRASDYGSDMSSRASEMSEYVYDAVQRYLPDTVRKYMHS